MCGGCGVNNKGFFVFYRRGREVNRGALERGKVQLQLPKLLLVLRSSPTPGSLHPPAMPMHIAAGVCIRVLAPLQLMGVFEITGMSG